MGTGWIPDPPDERDFTPRRKEVKRLLPATGGPRGLAAGERAGAEAAAPPRVDLRAFFPRVGQQGQLNSCTAFTAAALLAYAEKTTFGRGLEPSPLFLYKVERNLLNQTGDGGAFLRTAMKALRAFGAPPEEVWPYHPPAYEVEPSAYAYALAANFKASVYFRHDAQGVEPDELLDTILTSLAGGVPAMFGFVMFPSIAQSYRPADRGEIPFPSPGEQPVGLHALVAAGYDDGKQIVNRLAPRPSLTTGALLIRNSWGAEWGDGGYGWLPYEYVRQRYATDWWSLVRADVLDAAQFERDGGVDGP